jgi:hypothetical protein
MNPSAFLLLNLAFGFYNGLRPPFPARRTIFQGRGAYARFKDLLGGRGMLDQWYDFEAKAVERALKMWCDLNSIEVSNY